MAPVSGPAARQPARFWRLAILAAAFAVGSIGGVAAAAERLSADFEPFNVIDSANPSNDDKCAKCNVPVEQGGCKCDNNCDCKSAPGGKCAKCNVPVEQGGCKCDNNCDCKSGPVPPTGGHSDWLNPHNAARRAVNRGLPDLTWSDNEAAFAQNWANHLANERGCALEHSGAGENLWWISVPNHSDAAGAVSSWVNERNTWRCGSKQYNHYTQVVWKDTRAVGCACASQQCGTVCACHYNPVGNYVGQDPYPC